MLSEERIVSKSPRRFTQRAAYVEHKGPWHRPASWKKGHLLFEQKYVCPVTAYCYDSFFFFFSDLHRATKGSHVSAVAEDDSYLLL